MKLRKNEESVEVIVFSALSFFMQTLFYPILYYYILCEWCQIGAKKIKLVQKTKSIKICGGTADAEDSKSTVGDNVRVQIPSPVLTLKFYTQIQSHLVKFASVEKYKLNIVSYKISV